MENFVLILLIVETLFLVGVVFVLLNKSRRLSKLFGDFSKLQNQEVEQERVQKERDDYLAMLVHELRSPLSVIRGSSDLIIKESENLSRQDIEKLLAQIRASSSSLLDIVNDILDVSKIEAGKFEVRKIKSNINKLLRDEIDYYKALTSQKKIELSVNLQADLPDFMFDPDRVKQVLNNLISNAIKFTPENGKIKLEAQRVDGSMRVSVSDNGIGITDDQKPRLFHKFVQLQNANVSQRGTGLGLVIAKGIVEAHGGSIWIEDAQPHGAKFCFMLPFAKE